MKANIFALENIQHAMYTLICTDQIVQTRLYRSDCTDQIVQPRLYGLDCTDQIVRTRLYRLDFTDQITQTRLYRLDCTDQMIQTRLYRLDCTDYIVKPRLYDYIVQTRLYRLECTDQIVQTRIDEELHQITFTKLCYKIARKKKPNCSRLKLSKYRAFFLYICIFSRGMFDIRMTLRTSHIHFTNIIIQNYEL